MYQEYNVPIPFIDSTEVYLYGFFKFTLELGFW